MFSAVLFDLDGTLLDIDIDAFLRRYFGLLGPVLASLTGNRTDANEALAAVIAGTEAMATEHSGKTNQHVFNARFRELTGVELLCEPAASTVERFYAEDFPTLGRSHGPRPGVTEVLSAVRSAGIKCALATNPIFPRAAIDERARWAGVDTSVFDYVTSYENMYACKPSLDYFTQIAEQLGVDPRDCLMVGDDALLDLPAREIGMQTFYVGEMDVESDWCGDLLTLAQLLAQEAD